jgi:hypothetical protein
LGSPRAEEAHVLSFFADPYELPAALTVLGLLAILLASLRGRTALPQRRRRLRWCYGVVGALAIAMGLGVGVQHARAFWSAEWDGQTSQIRLDRPFPMSDVHLPARRVDYVSEVSAPERSISGVRRVVRFEVRLHNGDSYRSTPFRGTEELDGLRRTLAAANGGRLQQFLIKTR